MTLALQSTSNYLEIMMNRKDFEEATPTGLGLMLQRLYQENPNLPMVLRVTDDFKVKPWATDNETNYNRIDYEGD